MIYLSALTAETADLNGLVVGLLIIDRCMHACGLIQPPKDRNPDTLMHTAARYQPCSRRMAWHGMAWHGMACKILPLH